MPHLSSTTSSLTSPIVRSTSRPTVDWPVFRVTIEGRVEGIRVAATSMRTGRSPCDAGRVRELLGELRALAHLLECVTRSPTGTTADIDAFLRMARDHVYRLWTTCTRLQEGLAQ